MGLAIFIIGILVRKVPLWRLGDFPLSHKQRLSDLLNMLICQLDRINLENYCSAAQQNFWKLLLQLTFHNTISESPAEFKFARFSEEKESMLRTFLSVFFHPIRRISMFPVFCFFTVLTVKRRPLKRPKSWRLFAVNFAVLTARNIIRDKRVYESSLMIFWPLFNILWTLFSAIKIKQWFTCYCPV